MNRKGLSLLLATQLALFGSMANADIIIHTGDPSVCTKLQGQWSGVGSVSALKGTVKCTYSGVGVVKMGPDSSQFTMDITLKKQKGICPVSESENMTGQCNSDGTIKLSTSGVNITGSLVPDGTHISNINGTIDFTLLGKTITADVYDMDLHKS